MKWHLSISEVHLILLEHLPADHTAVVHNDIEVRPGSELPLPVSDGGEWGDDEKRPLDPCATDLIQKCDGLDGLTQTHLISQNTVTPANEQQVFVENSHLHQQSSDTPDVHFNC